MIKLVAVDFDNTLCMTEAGTYKLESDVCLAMGFPMMDREVHKKTSGMILHESMKLRMPGIDIDEFVARLHAEQPKYVASGILDKIDSKNIETLRRLKKAGVSIVILSSRSKIELLHMMEIKHPLSKLIDDFYYYENTTFHKPDPRVFDPMIQKYKFKRSEIVYIGDTVSDVVATKEASIHFIASLECGLRTKSDFADVIVDEFVEDFVQIEPLILSDRFAE